MEFDKTLLAGSTGMMVLKLLEQEDMYGYQMIETLRERSEHSFDLKAGTLYPLLHALEQKGLINRDPKKPRTIEVVEKQSEPQTSEVKLADVSQDLDNNVISLPLVGRVAAGTPILAEQNVEETLSLPTSIVGDASSFILRVRGESMVNAGIYDGDYIVVKEQKDAHNGEIVVALIDDSATVKTFYREKDRIRLQPENDTMSPIYADNPVILGKVTALIRSIS